MVVICRIDLDKHDALFIAKLYAAGVITLADCMNSRVYREMSELHQLLWKRQVMDMRPKQVLKEAI